jgi:broad specificity phosphatase PhoE
MIQITHFYFIRHGQTQAHIDKLICGGSWNIELTEEGLLAARKAANLHKDKLADVQRIVSSPLKRTEQTARFFSEVLNIKVEHDPTIAEWSLGE